jgi:isopentenyl-diphosphate delta-isomerase
MNRIEIRKNEHVDIAVKEEVEAHQNYWDYIRLVHNALPEINKEEVDFSTTFLGKKLGAPIIIAGMTGGYKDAKKINENLAIAAEKYQIGMGVGSQRSALEKKNLEETYSIIKKYDIPFKIANIGASQLVEWGYPKSLENTQKLIDMIDADAIAICLNFLQEVIQLEGEANAKGCYELIKRLAEDLDKPVIVKETGAGISRDVAKKLSKTKIACIDVGGLGGTSFAAIEHYRAKRRNDTLHARGGKTFWDWGIPTPISIIETGVATKWRIPIIATGGIRNGLDVAKAIAIGADVAGIARVLLKAAVKSKESTIAELEAIIKELRAAMFLVGADNIEKMKMTEVEIWI